MTWKPDFSAIFDGEVLLSDGLNFDHSRPYAVTSLAEGTIAAVDEPHFGDDVLVCGAPEPVTLDTDGTATQTVAGGVWLDGTTPCFVQYRQKSSPNPARVNIWVNLAITANACTGNPASRSVDIRCTGADLGGNKNTQVDLLRTSADESATEVWAPYAFQVVQGIVLAACALSEWTGSAWEIRATGYAIWNEAAGQWRRLYRTRNAQAALNRGREWVMAQYWPLDNRPVHQSTEIMLVWTDYGVNGGSPTSQGGQLSICRLSRATTANAWTVGTAVLLYEETGISTNRHYHNACAFRSGSSGVVVTISIGDGLQAELVQFHRADSSQYAQGWDGSTPLASTTDAATQNGWTTYRKRAGSPTVMGNTPAYGWNQFMGLAPLPGQTQTFVVGNDEGTDCLYWAHFPDPSLVTDRAWFEQIDTPVRPPSFRRGWLVFGIWTNDYCRDYGCVVHHNSSSQSGTGGTNEIQAITFNLGSGAASGTFTLTHGADTTGAITYSGTPATMIANIKAALEALTSIGASNTSVTNPSTNVYYVEFVATRARTNMSTMTATPTMTNASITMSVVREGVATLFGISWGMAGAPFHQGFSAAVAAENTRLLYSPNGRHWGIFGAPNTQARPCWYNGYFIVTGNASFGKILAYPRPKFVMRSPFKVSPAYTQLLISTLGTPEAPATNNTRTVVSPAAFGVADAIVTGRTIPGPPCNGPVLRWTDNAGASKYGGTVNLTTGTPITEGQYILVKVWLYQLPPSIPFVNDNTAPYNNPRTSLRLQLLRAGTGEVMDAASGDCDSKDASGWTCFTYVTKRSEWVTPTTTAMNLGMRLTDSGSGQTNMDVLIAFEAVHAASSPMDFCTHPLPVSNAAIASPTAIDHDYAVVDGLDCGDAWSLVDVVQIPDNAWDQYVDVRYRPTNPRGTTYYESSTRYIYWYLDYVNRRIIVGDAGGTVSIAPPAGENFVFDRGNIIALFFSSSGTSLDISVMCGGTKVATASLVLARAVSPKKAILADNNTAPILALDRFGIAGSYQTEDATTRATALRDIQTILAKPKAITAGGSGGGRNSRFGDSEMARRIMEPWAYSTPRGTADGDQADYPAVATDYETLAAIQALAGAVYIPLNPIGDPQRINLRMVADAEEGFDGGFQVYHVSKRAITGTDEIKYTINYVGTMTNLFGTDPVGDGRNDHVYAASGEWETSGWLESVTGQTPKLAGLGVAGSPVGLSIPDCANAEGLLVLCRVGPDLAANGVAMQHQRWS